MAFAPVRSSRRGWRDKAYRWFTRKPLSPAHLVFTDEDDARFTVTERDEWLAPPEVPLEGGVSVREEVGREGLTFTTSRVGHPLLVKISYHPRWKAEGADGPYLVSPALMMVIPRQPTVRLTYSRDASDLAGAGLTAGALLLGGWSLARRGRRRPAPDAPTTPAPPTPLTTDACDLPAATRRWGGAIPAALILALVASRFAVPDRAKAAAREAAALRDKAVQARAAGQLADAAEYARQGAARAEGPLKSELLCLRADSLSRAGGGGEAEQARAEASAAGATCPASP